MGWIIFLYVIPAWITSLVLLDGYWERKLERPDFSYFLCIVFAASTVPLLNWAGPLYLLNKLEQAWDDLWNPKAAENAVRSKISSCTNKEVLRHFRNVQAKILEQRGDPRSSWLEQRAQERANNEV